MAATPWTQAPSGTLHRRRIRWIDVKEQLTGYLFILPAVTIITVFGFFPIGYAIYMSTFNWWVKKGANIGFDNYHKAIGDWSGALIFAVGFVILLLVYLAWDRAFKAQSTSAMLLRLGTAFLLIAAWFVIPIGWERMIAAGDKNFLD